MNSKQIFSLLIAAGTILAVSLVLSLYAVKPNVSASTVSPIAAYEFNIGSTNDDAVRVTSNKLKLSNAVNFAPTRTVEWSTNFVTYLGTTVSEGVELASTQTGEFVCVIPFAINNYKEDSVMFNISVSIDGGMLRNFIDYKIYDFVDKQYKTCEEINNSIYRVLNVSVNEIKANSSRNFCLVACAGVGAQDYLGDSVNININIEKV